MWYTTQHWELTSLDNVYKSKASVYLICYQSHWNPINEVSGYVNFFFSYLLKYKSDLVLKEMKLAFWFWGTLSAREVQLMELCAILFAAMIDRNFAADNQNGSVWTRLCNDVVLFLLLLAELHVVQPIMIQWEARRRDAIENGCQYSRRGQSGSKYAPITSDQYCVSVQFW